MLTWMGQRLSDILGLDELLPIGTILSCDFGSDGRIYQKSHGTQIISLEDQTGIRQNWSNFSLNSFLTSVDREVLRASLKNTRWFLPYASVRSFHSYLTKNMPNITYLGIKPELKNLLDDKFFFRRLTKRLGLDILPGFVSLLKNDQQFAMVSSKLGLPFVAQLSKGASGSGTFPVSDLSDWQALCNVHSGKKFLFTKYVDGCSFNINAVVNSKRIILSSPSVQILGLTELATKKMTYCGNDFKSMNVFGIEILKNIYEMTNVIGAEIRRLGYRGIFGIDFLSDFSGKIYPVELNPRFQGSTQLLANLQISNGIMPISLDHILAFDDSILFKQYEPQSDIPRINMGSQIILHNLSPEAMEVKGSVSPGIYKYRDLKFDRFGTTVRDCNDDSEVLVTCSVPECGLVIDADAPLLKLHAPFSFFDTSTKSLYPDIRKFVLFLYEQIKLTSPDISQ